MGDLKKIRYIFDRGQKTRLVLLGFIIIIGSLCELLGVTAILPFIEVAMDENSVFKNKWLRMAYEMLHMQSATEFLIFLAVALIVIYVVKNVYLGFMNYAIYRYTYNNQRRIAVRMQSAYMKQPYTFFLGHNSSELVRNVDTDTSMLFDTVLSALQLMVELIVCLLLLVYLMIMDKTITIAVGIVIVIAFLAVVRTLKKDLKQRGQTVRECRADMSRWLYQSFGGIKETKISERESYFVDTYDGIYSKFAHNHCIYQTFSYIPKPLMETLCVCSLLAVVAFKLFRGVDSSYFVTTMSVFAVAAFRLLPSFNRITGYVSHILFNHTAVTSIYNDLKEIERLEAENAKRQNIDEELPFTDEIRINDICFHYPGIEENVLEKINLTIPKNKSVALIGPSGAGKTTIADIILGVLSPQEGQVLVDGIDAGTHMSKWHAKLGYIPQTIYLNDDTIKHNIAFALNDKDIDEARLQEVIKEAQLEEFIASLEDGVDTVIGERGVRLSGGQRQRIGIARALYDNPEVLILDEATSALDSETETAVMDAIDSLAGKKTLIIIAHRLTTIRNCDIVYEISNHVAQAKNKAEVIK
ncbi:MAG: ABC transporter ATP-binding protein [Lachnospiraceae bacterium]|nr:ABC transporter ATP-binding protein [Candidatus Colinaster equi]